MKKIILSLSCLMAAVITLTASVTLAEEIKTTDGKVYKDVVILEETPEYVKFKHADGLAKIPREKIRAAGSEGGAPGGDASSVDSAARITFIKGKMAEIKTRDGRTYLSKDLSEVTANQMKFVSSSGIHKVKFSELPADVAGLLGWNKELSDAQDSMDAEQQQINAQKRQQYIQAESILKTATFEGKVKPFLRLKAGWLCEVSERRVQADGSDPGGLGLVWGLADATVMQTGQQAWSSQLYYVGKYSYSTQEGEKEVPIFFTDRNGALNHLVKFGLGTVNNNDITKVEGGKGVVEGWGSGFFISKEGHIATNFHVVKGAAKVTVHAGGKQYEGKVIAKDEIADLALVKVEGVAPGVLAVKADTGAAIGDSVFTLGFPRPDTQGMNAKYTEGTISSLTGIKDSRNHFQVSVPIQPGNSGGALVDDSGAVVGIIVATLNHQATLNSSSGLPQNVNYAIKSSLLLSLCQKSGVKTEAAMPVLFGLKPARKDCISKAEKAAVLIKISG